jgi:hypothetical protein
VSPSPRPRSILRGAVITGLALTLAVSGVLVLEHQRQQTATAREADVAAARASLAGELAPLHAELHAAAHAARTDLASTRLLVTELLTSDERDTEAIVADLETRVAALRDVASTLEGTARDAAPTMPADLPSEEAEPALRTVTEATGLSVALADELHTRLDDLETRLDGAAVLAGTFDAIADVTALPETDDADDWSAAWAEEQERLEELRDDVAPLLTEPTLGPLAGAQLALLDELERLATDAADALDDGDIDAHNDRVAELDDERVAELTEGVQASLTSTLTALTVPLELTEDAATGTTHLLEELRRTASGAAAGGRTA